MTVVLTSEEKEIVQELLVDNPLPDHLYNKIEAMTFSFNSEDTNATFCVVGLTEPDSSSFCRVVTIENPSHCRFFDIRNARETLLQCREPKHATITGV